MQKTWLKFKFYLDSGNVIDYTMSLKDGIENFTISDLGETLDEIKRCDNYRYAEDGSGFYVNLNKLEFVTVQVIDAYGQIVRVGKEQ